MLIHEEIKTDSQRKRKITPFIDKYNLEGISYPSEKDYRKETEKII